MENEKGFAVGCLLGTWETVLMIAAWLVFSEMIGIRSKLPYALVIAIDVVVGGICGLAGHEVAEVYRETRKRKER